MTDTVLEANQRALLKAAVRTTPLVSIPDRNEWVEAKRFLVFTALHVLHSRKVQADLSAVEAGITDSVLAGGQPDFSIDAAYVLLNGELLTRTPSRLGRQAEVELVLIQSKSGKRDLDQSELKKSVHDIPEALTADPRALHATETLKTVLRIWHGVQRKAAPHTELVMRITCVHALAGFARTKTVASSVQRSLAASVSRNVHATLELHVLDAAALLNLMRSRAPNPRTLEFTADGLVEDEGCWLGLVRLSDYYQFLIDRGADEVHQLFEENIRDHQGRSIVNRGIQASLANPGEPFWPRNNGITILARKADRAGGHARRLRLDDPQVVNGLQTSREIERHFRERAAPARRDRRKVQVRVLSGMSQGEELHIIQATNWQNKITAASLRAADEWQRSIELFLFDQGIRYERRKGQYGRRQHINIRGMAQALACLLLQRPDIARGRPESELLNPDAPRYEELFDPKIPLDLYMKAYQAADVIENFVRDLSGLPRGNQRTNARPFLLMASGMLATRRARPTPRQLVGANFLALPKAELRQALHEYLLALEEVRREMESALDTEISPDRVAKSENLTDNLRTRIEALI